MQKKLKLPRCPYCHRKISFLGAYFLKTKGEYCCDTCKCISNVVINRSIYGIASLTCVLSLLILVLYSYFGDHGSLLGILLVLLPFIIFYAFVPFFVRLEPCADRSYEKKIIEKKTVVPETAYNPTVTETYRTNPIELNVSEDFSKNFIKTKNMVEQQNKYETETETPKDENNGGNADTQN